MTSSTTGDRRWAAARRSGMTVLGKVTVPKPINLPSQRLENQGLDPNVEIVPKGTLSWGSKTSSNAWGSSSLSPRTDSGTRPSSGGSGTRPSTAGSDGGQELIANAWASNSRPSSASGLLTSEQRSGAPLRPRSADTRPGSSQLSRFAEPLSGNSGAWAAPTTAEKLGVLPAKRDGFSLISGDFPSLGSGKEDSVRNIGSPDHGSHVRPGSSSGRLAALKERTEASAEGDASVDAHMTGGNVNSWTRDNHPFGKEGVQSSLEDHQAELRGPPYPNAGIPHQPFDTWRGPPLNHPGGVWYRGPPGGPSYGPSVPAAGFPMEPFSYYRPQVPPSPLTNHQSVPPPGAGPPGNLSQGGDMFRPSMPDTYIRPGMPIRPGFYPGPVPYEGYYGPPMGYCNLNERDMPFMGMPPGPSGYNRYPVQNTGEPVSALARSGGHGPHGKPTASEHADHSHETQGPYKVLLKPQEAWDHKDEGKVDGPVKFRGSDREREDKHRPLVQDNPWRAAHRKDVERDTGRRVAVIEESTQVFDHQRHGLEAHDANAVKKAENSFSASPDIGAASNTSSLFQKIEGLNAKARTSAPLSSRDDQTYKTHTDNCKRPVNEIPNRNPRRAQMTEIIEPAPHGVGDPVGSRRCMHGVRTRTGSRGRGRYDSEERDGWQERPPISDSSSVVSSTNLECSLNVDVRDSSEAVGKPAAYSQERNKGESVPSVFDSSDSQRAMMRELALQRAKQRQEEEEEREREQKAKANAKLEELNRRTQADSTKTVEALSGSSGLSKPEDSLALVNVPFASRSSSVSTHETNASRTEGSTSLSNQVYTEARKTNQKEAALLKEHVSCSEIMQSENPQDGKTSRQKHVGFKQNRSVPVEKKFSEKSSSPSTTEAIGVVTSQNVVNEVVLSHDPNSTVGGSITTETSAHPRKKNNRNSKKKHKVDEELSTVGASGPAESKETDIADTLVDSGKPKVSNPEVDSGSVQSPRATKKTSQPADQHAPSPDEDTHGKTTNQLKSQHTRRTQRNSVANKQADKFHGSDAVMWAPVRTQNKTEVVNELSQNDMVDSVSSLKSANQVPNNPRTKRLEMERYIPKPVAKEMAQQAVIQQAAAPAASADTVQGVDCGSLGSELSQPAGLTTVKPGSTLEHRNGRQSRHGKGPGSWRQRNTAESSRAEFLENELSSKPSHNSLKPVNDQVNHQTQKTDVGSVRDRTETFDGWNYSDGWNMPESPEHLAPAAAQAVPVGKEQEMTGRGKWQAFRGHKGMGNSHVDQNKGYVQHSASEMSQIDAPKDSRATGDRSTSHWQPKSQTSIHPNQRGNRSSGTQRTEGVRAGQKDFVPPSEVPLSHGAKFASNKNNTEEAPDFEHQEPSRRRKSSVNKKTHYSNQGPGGPSETVPSSRDAQFEQRPPSGYGKNRNQNNQSGKGLESHGDWGTYGRDDWNHRPPSNRDRPRHASRYEYQPVGKHNNDQARDSDQRKDTSHNSVPRFQEKGLSHPRGGRGRFYSQQSGRVRGDGNYD